MVPPAALLNIIQKGLQYTEAEISIAEVGLVLTFHVEDNTRPSGNGWIWLCSRFVKLSISPVMKSHLEIPRGFLKATNK